MIKGTLLAIIVITLSGYIFNTTYIGTKYRVPKFQGTHLLYRSLFGGLLITSLSTIFFILFWPLTSQSTYLFDKTIIAFPSLSQSEFNLYSILIVSLALAITVGKAANFVIFRIFNFLLMFRANELKTKSLQISGTLNNSRLTNLNAVSSNEAKEELEQEVGIKNSKLKDKNHRKRIKKETAHLLDIIYYKNCTDNVFINHVLDAVLTPRLLLITLASRRCYVCYPYEIKTPKDHIEAQELAIIPLYSGFRDQDSICFEITTPYEDIIRILKFEKSYFTADKVKECEATIDSYKITLPYNQIQTMASFDPSKYIDFKNNEKFVKETLSNSSKEGDDSKEKSVN